MNFLGMGPLELMLIVVLALIVFGPAKLPEIMGQIGRAIGDFRRATSELSDEFNRTIQTELNETKQTIEETKSALTEVRTSIDSTVSETRAAVSGLPAPTRVASPSVEANGLNREESSTNGSAPPLADTSQWSWETTPERTESAAGEATEPLPVVSDATEPLTVVTESGATSAEGEAASSAEDEPTPETADGTPPPRERAARDDLQPPY